MCNTQRRPIRQIMRPNGLMVIRALRSARLPRHPLIHHHRPSRFAPPRLAIPRLVSSRHPLVSPRLTLLMVRTSRRHLRIINKTRDTARVPAGFRRKREKEKYECRARNANPCRREPSRAEPGAPWSNDGVAFAYRNLEGTNFS